MSDNKFDEIILEVAINLTGSMDWNDYVEFQIDSMKPLKSSTPKEYIELKPISDPNWNEYAKIQIESMKHILVSTPSEYPTFTDNAVDEVITFKYPNLN